MSIIEVDELIGVDCIATPILREVMKSCNPRQQLTIVLYMMSDMLVSKKEYKSWSKDEQKNYQIGESYFEKIKSNLRKILPEKDFFSEFKDLNSVFREDNSFKMLWENLRARRGLWKNTYFGNQYALHLLEKSGVKVIYKGKVQQSVPNKKFDKIDREKDLGESKPASTDYPEVLDAYFDYKPIDIDFLKELFDKKDWQFPVNTTLVEVAAVEYAKKKIKEKQKGNWTIKPVQNCGYDLLCTGSNDKELHVKIKGTIESSCSFVLEEDELLRAKTDNKFILYLVTNVLENPELHIYRGQKIFEKFSFTEVKQYQASLNQ